MPDLNELLRWSIANSAQPSSGDADPTPSAGTDSQLSIRFNPAVSGSSSHATALHPSDPLYRARDADAADASPASTPGPTTPVAGEPVPLPGGARRDDLTSEMLDVIMGKSESVEMREAMAAAVDEAESVESRVQALDNFEMLIENIDNANNMAVLKLWQPLLTLLSSSEEEIVSLACWIIGTAVQNNLKAQAALFLNDALPQLLPLLSPPHPTSVRAKATYALSSFLKHWPLASSALSTPASASSSSTGYAILRANLAPSTPTVLRRKTAFLVHALTQQDGETYEGDMPGEVRNLIEEHARATGAQLAGAGAGTGEEGLVQGLDKAGVYSALVEELERGEEGDVDVQENAMRALAAARGKGLGAELGERTARVWARWGVAGQEERGLGGEDGKIVAALLA